MAEYSFRTIAAPAEGQYREKGSRFLAFAYPVETEAEINAHLSILEKKFFDARHHCFAWMLGPEKKSFRANDDGEPNHSAGDPILGQIRSRDLTDILVVVVRYFGGVKLGVGGLITAYKAAAGDAFRHAEIIEREVRGTVEIIYDYGATAEVMRLVKEFDLAIDRQRFEANCQLTARFKLRDRGQLFEKLGLLEAMGIKVQYRSTLRNT